MLQVTKKKEKKDEKSNQSCSVTSYSSGVVMCVFLMNKKIRHLVDLRSRSYIGGIVNFNIYFCCFSFYSLIFAFLLIFLFFIIFVFLRVWIQTFCHYSHLITCIYIHCILNLYGFYNRYNE